MMKNQSDLVYEIKSEGGRINTVDVVNLAIQLRDKAKKEGNPYDSVWAVFDKDSFPDDKFNQAIKKAEANGIGCAWSNEAFELWYASNVQKASNDYNPRNSFQNDHSR